eukprot:TRINITY_DN97807_c0_g1_i1.p1 TRINITY_DN97807_c0_g1~~TRINITY_DN97807_c0_g1_i1.p1  ORF type:complete len:510 (-),score=80.55 TRINITY_DN97807_c0_g1_i1:17-1546(-)
MAFANAVLCAFIAFCLLGVLGMRTDVQRSAPNLEGLWMQKRTKFGKEILERRFYDVVASISGDFTHYKVFPLTACNEGGAAGAIGLGGSTRCNEVIYFQVMEQEDGVLVVSKSGQGRHGSISAVVTSTSEVDELQWLDGKIWYRSSALGADAPFLGEEFADEECSAMGPGGSRPVEYKFNIGASFALHTHNLPGIMIDVIGCVTNDWIGANRDRFDCILKKAVRRSANNSSDSWSRQLNSALGKLQAALPSSDSVACIPTFCHITTFPKFPIPSPVPSQSLVMAWPKDAGDCNGKVLHAEIGHLMQELPNQETLAIKEAEESTLVYSHGLAFTYFPLPGTAYWSNSQVVLGKTISAQRSLSKATCEEMRAKVAMHSERLEAAVQAASKSCPDVYQRLTLRYREIKEDLSTKSLAQKHRLWLGRLPELGGLKAIRGGKLDFNAGYYGQIGIPGGFQVGVFTGVAWSGRDLGQRYRGCREWKKVIKLWYESPSTELDTAASSQMLDCDLGI